MKIRRFKYVIAKGTWEGGEIMKSIEEIKSNTNLIVERVGIDGGHAEMFKLGKRFASVIFSWGGGWEHISVCPHKRSYTPTWSDMCMLKDMFFKEDETVVQYHPMKSEYVNNVPNCLHLWRPTNETMPTPPSIMVGIKSEQTVEEIRELVGEINNTES